jgi:hypothetical protein
VFENRVPKRDEITGEWRKLIRSLIISTPHPIRLKPRMRWAGHVARIGGGGRSVHKVLVGKPEGKKPLGRPGRRWKDNIKMVLQEVG